MSTAPLSPPIRYAFDNYLSRGTVVLVLALFAVTALIVVVASFVVWITGWFTEEGGSSAPSGDRCSPASTRRSSAARQTALPSC